MRRCFPGLRSRITWSPSTTSRNVDYRTETDYFVHHYDRTFDLTTLQSVDLFVVYWGAPGIAHSFISFGFRDESYLYISIETRKELGEEYSAIKGLFKQFELTYVVADERDLVRLRTNYRTGEDVYLYRFNVSMDYARKVLLDYLREVNSLKDHPQWYRAILTNCTSSILRHTTPYNPDARFDWRLITNGYLDKMLGERGKLDHFSARRIDSVYLTRTSAISPSNLNGALSKLSMDSGEPRSVPISRQSLAVKSSGALTGT